MDFDDDGGDGDSDDDFSDDDDDDDDESRAPGRCMDNGVLSSFPSLQ